MNYLLSILFVFLFAFSAYGKDTSKGIGGGNLRLIDISLDALLAGGASTEEDEILQNLQGGGHDPRKRGFTVQNVELSLSGAIDPYLTGESHIIYFLDPLSGETVVELEEAFLTTLSLPHRLQLEAGHFFTEFGRINLRHPHAWHWQDQPVINTRLFGPDGMRGPGFRLGWLLPLSWFSELHFGAQNANGETMVSFLANEEFFDERAIGNRPFADRGVKTLKDLVYLLRLDNALDLSDEVTAKLGLYTQLLYGFKPGWAAGLRYEYATGSGGGRESDPFRDDRNRVSPLATWMPTEFSRFRAKYNYDRADHLPDREAHSVWLGAEFLYGAHAAHSF